MFQHIMLCNQSRRPPLTGWRSGHRPDADGCDVRVGSRTGPVTARSHSAGERQYASRRADRQRDRDDSACEPPEVHWQPEGEHGSALTIEAFGEEDAALSVPAPLIRVTEGATIVVSDSQRPGCAAPGPRPVHPRWHAPAHRSTCRRRPRATCVSPAAGRAPITIGPRASARRCRSASWPARWWSTRRGTSLQTGSS